MSLDRKVRVVREEASSSVYLETVDPNDDCTVTDRVCIGAPGSTRFEWVLDELLRGTQKRLVRR